MVCKVCEKEIERGKRYKSPTFTSIPFCSENCYENYVEQKKQKAKEAKAQEKKDEKAKKIRRMLTDYIKKIYAGNVNWPMYMTQVKKIEEEYCLDDKGLFLAIKYGIEYSQKTFDPNFGLYQFIDCIQPAQDFCEAIERSKAQEIKEEEAIVVKRKSRKRFWQERR